MNAWTRKEWRLLLPAGVAAVGIGLLAVGAVRLLGGGFPVPGVSLVAVFAICLLLSVQVFGGEFAHGTATLLLSQPVPRTRLWRTKTRGLWLGVALVVVLDGLSALAWQVPRADWLFVHGAAVLAAVGGGLFFSLLMRQTGPALWMGALAPLGIWVFLGLAIWLAAPASWLSSWQFSWLHRGWGILGLAYGLLTLWLARRRFIRIEDRPVWGGELHLSWPGSGRTGKRQGTPRAGGTPRAIWRALRRKERRLQQLNWIMAGCLSVLTVAATLSLKVQNAAIVLDFVLPMLVMVWGLVPLMVGAVAVAEERRLGVAEFQRTLPLAVLRQWWFKVRRVLELSFLLGVVLPFALESLLFWLTSLWTNGPHSNLQGNFPESLVWLAGVLGFPQQSILLVVQVHVLVWLVAVTAGLYASSLTRNLLQGLALAIASVVGLWALALGASWLWLKSSPLDPSPFLLSCLVGAVVLIPTLLWLGGRNYRDALSRGQLARLNVGVLVGALALTGALTTAGYCRVWESWLPDNVGKPLPAKLGVRAKLATSYDTVAVLLPDGRIRARATGWLRPWFTPPPAEGRPVAWEMRWLGEQGEWRDVAACRGTVFGIRTDGTLWAWGWRWTMTNSLPAGLRVDPRPDARLLRAWLSRHLAPPPGSYAPKLFKRDPGPAAGRPPREPIMIRVWPQEQPWQVDAATNWTAVVGSLFHAAALRGDGTAWGWGYGVGKPGLPKVATAASPRPVQLVPGTNWVSVAAGSYGDWIAVADNGTVRRSPVGKGWRDEWRLPEGLPKGRWLDLRPLGNVYLPGLLDDGRLWWRSSGYSISRTSGVRELWPGSRWRAATFTWNALWAVREDGSLWRWQARPEAQDGFMVLNLSGKERLGHRTDWLDVARIYWDEDVVALSADGRLWRFKDPLSWRDDGRPRLLRVTRRPTLLADFAAEK